MDIKYCERVNGKALFTKKFIKKNDLVFNLEGEILDKPTKYTIEISPDKHIYDKFGIFMNHSFNPTTKIVNKSVIALKDLNPGDELNFNYNDNETCMASPFETPYGKVFGKSFSVEKKNLS